MTVVSSLITPTNQTGAKRAMILSEFLAITCTCQSAGKIARTCKVRLLFVLLLIGSDRLARDVSANHYA